MSFKLTLDFATDEDRDSFIGWFLDGGGGQEFNNSREARGKPWLSVDGPNGGDWEWPGLDDVKEPLANYTIELRDIDEEAGE